MLVDGLGYNVNELDRLILYADNHLLAVNKPAGLLSQDSGIDKAKPGAVFLNAVHRIDRAVSGIVLFARTSKALSRLNEDIRKRNCRKIYHALVEGVPGKASDTLVHWLSHEHHRAEICCEGDTGAQRAVLRYQSLRRAGGMSLLEVDLETGRYHQIRAQLSAIGTPIAGDEKYGAKRQAEDGSIGLHHRQLEIVHPTLKMPLALEAPYPEDSAWWGLLD